MDEAARFTAEHSVMEAGIEIRSLKHKLELAESKNTKTTIRDCRIEIGTFRSRLIGT